MRLLAKHGRVLRGPKRTRRRREVVAQIRHTHPWLDPVLVTRTAANYLVRSGYAKRVYDRKLDELVLTEKGEREAALLVLGDNR
jgi:hypothetical protein